MRLGRSAALAATLVLAQAGHGAAAPGRSPPMSTQTSQTALALAALDRKIADLDAEEETDKRALAGLGPRLAQAHARVVQYGRAFYRMTRAGMLPLGGGFDALVTHAMHVERARRALIADVESAGQLRARGVEISQALERVAHDRVSLASQRSAMDAARLAMEDENRRRDAFDRAFATSSGASDYVAVYGGTGADPGSPAPFPASKGRLLFPILGRAEVRAAHREGTDGPGLEIHAPIGTVVRAVFAGRIAFADRYGAYGRIVILDHGDHYYSVSGNLASIDVKLGDDISA